MQETRSVLGAICSSYDTFFEAEKKIADYMMENKAAVVDMTVGELARASGTSDATVSRFCRRCGFKGFHNLKLTLAREVLEDEQKDQSVSNDIDRGDIRQSLQNILANKVAELTETVNMMDADNLEQILSRLENARMVQLAAVGNTIPVAMDGAFKFNQLGIPAVAGEIWETQAAYTFNLGPEDVVLIISNSGSSRRLQSLAQGFPSGADQRLPDCHGDPGEASDRGVLVLAGHSHGGDGNPLPSFAEQQERRCGAYSQA